MASISSNTCILYTHMIVYRCVWGEVGRVEGCRCMCVYVWGEVGRVEGYRCMVCVCAVRGEVERVEEYRCMCVCVCRVQKPLCTCCVQCRRYQAIRMNIDPQNPLTHEIYLNQIIPPHSTNNQKPWLLKNGFLQKHLAAGPILPHNMYGCSH